MVEPTSTETTLPPSQEPSIETPDPPNPPRARLSPQARERLAAVLFSFLLSTLVFIPIFRHGFPGGVDSDRHYQWITQFGEALKEPGVFYPRWLGSANNH